MTTAELITKIQDRRNKQADVSLYYCQAMTDHFLDDAIYDWKSINAAIMERWSRSGLNRIKRMAWKQRELGE